MWFVTQITEAADLPRRDIVGRPIGEAGLAMDPLA